MPTLKEEILNALNEMPRNYMYPPGATKEKKDEIKKKVGANVSDTLKRLSDFEKKVRNLLSEFESESKIEVAKIDDEESARYGPFNSMHQIRNKLNEILSAIAKAKTRTVNSVK